MVLPPYLVLGDGLLLPEPMLLPPGVALLPLPDDPLLGVLLVPLLGDDAPLLLGDDDAPLDAPLEPDLLK
jgi:hypothetical protein